MLYVSYACPRANQWLVFSVIKGLDDVAEMRYTVEALFDHETHTAVNNGNSEIIRNLKPYLWQVCLFAVTVRQWCSCPFR
ncbi:hypothetical protein Q4I30_004834 [Leishmania utingensis]|uniref:Uncharacterized protein n=1 Tax=Leishmania utingensis TaxID=653362 RepID=A0AAW3AEC9_9TRYP